MCFNHETMDYKGSSSIQLFDSHKSTEKKTNPGYKLKRINCKRKTTKQQNSPLNL